MEHLKVYYCVLCGSFFIPVLIPFVVSAFFPGELRWGIGNWGLAGVLTVGAR